MSATPHERAMAALREQCKELYQQIGQDAMLRKNDPVETLFTFAKSLIDDNSYIIGWNDGWDERGKRRAGDTP